MLQEQCSRPSMAEVPCQDSIGGSEGKLWILLIRRKTEEKGAGGNTVSRTRMHTKG